tara:strand:+ start:2099 stop:3448 length:1350 start_codon:yes stop_codon:yes gene_type:complete
MKTNRDMKFNNIIKTMIVEQGRYEILKKTYTQPKKKGETVKPAKMSLEQLNKIVLSDPTTRRDGDTIKKAGKYVNWVLKQFLQIEPKIEAQYGTPQFKKELKEKSDLFFEDLYKTTEDLQKFDRFKSQIDDELRDINRLTIDTLFNTVKDFSLEKATTTKAERKEMDVHPGSELVYSGSKYDVYMIEDQGDLGKEAACYYGGQNKETRWCTSAPGLSYFNTYIKQGPLYVLVDKTDTEVGEISGLPKHRYQFHFPSNQFMNTDDRQINLVEFLLGEEEGLREFFKPEFMKGLSNADGTEISVEYPRDAASKFIALYGFDKFFDDLPSNLGRLDFIKTSGSSRYGQESAKDLDIKIPSSIGRFRNMYALHLDGILSELPKEISNLEDLMFLSLPNNKDLKALPKEMAEKVGNDYKMKNLAVITLSGSNPNIVIPEEVKEMIEKQNIKVFQ